MVIGILQVELYIGDARSLKDKRSVIKGLKDRLHREHQVSVAEVDRQDAHQVGVLGIAVVSTDASHAQSVLAGVLNKMRADGRLVISDHHTEIMSGQ